MGGPALVPCFASRWSGSALKCCCLGACLCWLHEVIQRREVVHEPAGLGWAGLAPVYGTALDSMAQCRARPCPALPCPALPGAEVNLVNLERVGFNLRNFDMVLIWKVGHRLAPNCLVLPMPC